MKSLIQYALTLLVGLFTSLLVSSLFFGFDNTTQSVTLVLNNFTPIKREQITNTKILGVSDSQTQLNDTDLKINYKNLLTNEILPYPLMVPTKGVAGAQNYVYHSVKHAGIDIWTNWQGKGVNTGSSKGYPIHAACAGYVIRVHHPNEEVEVKCDLLDGKYAEFVPSLNIKTIYAHMGDAVTKQSFHSLRVGQRLEKGQVIGYQGNVSSIMPINRVTHLHFGIYDLSRPGRPPINPEIYIGVPTTIYGQAFDPEQK